MKENSGFLGNLTDGGNIVKGTYFVVGKHDRDEDRLGGDCLANLFRIHESSRVHRQVGHQVSSFFQRMASIQHGAMFSPGRDDVIALFLVKLGDSLDRNVVGFRCATAENDVSRLGMDQKGNLGSAPLNSFLGI